MAGDSKKLNNRQQEILRQMERSDVVRTSDLLKSLSGSFDVSRMTLTRDIKILIKRGLVKKLDDGRVTAYGLADSYKLLRDFDIDSYFTKQAMYRDVQEQFNHKVFDYFAKAKFLTVDEVDFLNELSTSHETKVAEFTEDSEVAMKREFERLVIDLAWKSSQIEGNTYTIFETEALIKEKVRAKGKTEQEAIMILNHKAAVDFIIKNQDYFKHITLKKIQELHGVLTGDMDVQYGFRKMPVRITGTKYKPPFGEDSIRSAMDKVVEVVNKLESPFEKALFVLATIAYIQPFQDGNKRTARMLANAILYASGLTMLSYSSADATEFRKAVVLFYEQNSIQYLKQIFMEQYKFAVENYFV